MPGPTQIHVTDDMPVRGTFNGSAQVQPKIASIEGAGGLEGQVHRDVGHKALLVGTHQGHKDDLTVERTGVDWDGVGLGLSPGVRGNDEKKSNWQE